MASVLATFAQLERRLIGERTKDALAAKKAAGVRLGRPVSISADVASRIVDLRAAGMTLRDVVA
jgi:DNA invertase Pin-like site-specific DNA recombinase